MANIFGANNFYYAKSQAMLYTVSQNADFITAGLVDPVFLPLGNQQRAATHLNEPKSQKILFIVAGSWGLFTNPELQNATFAKLLAQKTVFRFGKAAVFPLSARRSKREMRELCAYGGLRGFALGRAPDEKFARCLPNRLKQEVLRHLCDARRGQFALRPLQLVSEGGLSRNQNRRKPDR